MAPAKIKRVSKKNKKSWRKNVDLKDVDNFLEDQRLEERLGLKHSEQKDENLFEIDTKGDESNVSAETENFGKRKAQRLGNSMRLSETETPKCFEILVKRSAVPPHSINKTRLKNENGNSSVANRIIKRRTLKELSKAQSKLCHGDNLRNQNGKKKEGSYDLWMKNNEDRDLNGCSEWLSNDTIRHTLFNIGKCKKQIPKAVTSKTSLLPAVETPHPGLSYNPSLKDHKDILNKVVETEVKMINEEKHLNRVTTYMFSKVPEHKAEEMKLSEMTVGLSLSKSDSESEDNEEYRAVNPPVKNKKKTLRKRKKLKEALLLKEKLKQKRIEKKKLSDIYKLKKFNKALDKLEEKTLKNIEKRKEIKDKKLFTTKLLSHKKYEEPEMDFNLAEELSGNLREVVPVGNILHDRFKSLQKRNILQPTVKKHVKKRKMKKYEKAHTKMGWEPEGFVSYEKNVK